MSGEAEPRRSVRATKGQHTKAFDELEPATAPKRRQNRKSKKAQEQEQSQEPEEVIRCVCGATEQDEDSGEAWICCETCIVWQHNVCVGVSSFEDEIPDNYWCEQCRPQDHKDLLDGMAKGEKPWEARRKKHELEEAEEKKKKRGGRRARGKRTSDPKEAKDAKEELEKDTPRSKSKASPTPEAAAPKDKKETVAKQAKRKSREDSHEADGKTVKLRRVSERDAVPVSSKYTPPSDLAASVGELPGVRVGPAKALKKSLSHVIAAMVKSQELHLAEGENEEAVAEKYALQIERAVFDTHPVGKGQKEYSQQIKSLTFNLKNNPELCRGLLGGIHLPTTLAIMTSEQLASAELQRQTAEMRARAEKQSILYTSETGVRVRRTHKGEEVVEDENMATGADDPHAPLVKRESMSGERADLKGRSPSSQGHSQQPSPSQPNFDINKVFSTVRSPTVGHGRKPSVPAINTNGPGFDPDVDRMLEDENESPPYSPTEEAQDPDVVWRGSLAMSSIADFQATAKHVGGANFASFGPWTKLIPKSMTVAGRIPQQSAIEYLCSLRYSNLTDIVVVSIAPASPGSRQDFHNLIDYFVSKKRYGVVGNKVAGNVRDTYLVPVPAGEGGHPEFMLNLVDNYIPKSRTEPMLLAVFVYRNEPDQLRKALEAVTVQPAGVTATPTPGPGGYGGQRSNSTSGPAFSPATPQGAFVHQQPPPQQQPQPPPPPRPQPHPQQHVGGALQSTTPVPIPQPPYSYRPNQASPIGGGPTPSLSPTASAPAPTPPPAQMTEAQRYQAQITGQAVAQEVLGGLISAPTVQFLLPQAFQMTRKEWEVIKTVYEREPRSRDDLQYLGALLEKEGAGSKAENNPTTAAAAAAAAAGGGGGGEKPA
ncbi:SPOC domain-containing protein [Hirsutella rhossiliensis]|uniref:Transcription factor BYE1 n=1 Tax=Hirsutella rhossiliensis TaxID=111463 RepID=A0A9P8MQY1_9HYPO|nr:SPOC domain-containing protein [Hirsutella rhossiliensis]KAH0958541.1 SPOC domain-containing protein [Hirsutella rhossiliensis]